MSVLKLVLTNSKFWGALLILVNAVLYYFVPNFPKEIWASFDALVSVTLSVMLVGDVRKDQREIAAGG
jgi:hypothetical protein